jgi:hypothetical protein
VVSSPTLSIGDVEAIFDQDRKLNDRRAARLLEDLLVSFDRWIRLHSSGLADVPTVRDTQRRKDDNDG